MNNQDAKPWSERHFVKLHGKIIELTDAEYAARADRIFRIRSECALERARERQQAEQAEKSKAKPLDPLTPGLDRLADYMRSKK